MVDEDRARSVPARSMRESARLEMRDSAHSRVAMAEWELNRHIRECEKCKKDGRKPQNLTKGQF